MKNNIIAGEILKIAKEVLAYDLGDEGWLLPNGTYLEVKMFQGHTQLVIDWFINRYARGKEKKVMHLFTEARIDKNDWKSAGFPLNDMHYFMVSSYDPAGYAFDNGWIRINESGFELPDVSKFRHARDFLLSKLSVRNNKSKPIFFDIHNGRSFVTSVEELIEAESLLDLRRF